MLLAGGVTLVSCSDTNDWDTDGSFARLFSVANGDITVEAEDTYATITIDGRENTQYYVLEISTDTLYDDIPLGGTAHSMVFGTNKEITPGKTVVVQNLVGDTKYHLRLKGCADNMGDSRWSYYKDGGTFKTKAEQIFDEAATVLDDGSLTVVWDASKAVTHIDVADGAGEVVATYQLTDADKQSGQYEIKGLSPTTTYIITIYNGEDKRGQLRVTTPASVPDADFKYFLPEDVTTISQVLMDEISTQALDAGADPSNYSVTIGIPAGMKVDFIGVSETNEPAAILIPSGMSVTFFGLAGGEKPVFNLPKSVNLEGSHAFLRFENLTITDGGCQYFINQSKASTVGELSLKGITIDGMERSLIRTQGSEAIAISNVIVDDCVMTNMSSGNGYSVFYFGTPGTDIGKLEIKNSTFNTSQRSFIEASKAPVTNGIFISDCTFYNNVASGRYFMDANGQSTNLTMTNVILGKTFDAATSRGARTAGAMTFTNCLRTSDCVYGSNNIADLPAGEQSSADIFKDPENGDFTLKINTKIGDPRWIPSED